MCQNADRFYATLPSVYLFSRESIDCWTILHILSRKILDIIFIVISFKHPNFIIFLLFSLAVITILPPSSIADRIINIRELNSCLVADVCWFGTFLSAPGGERSTHGCRVRQRFSRRHCMLLHWKTNKQMSICLPLAIDTTRLKLALLIAAFSLI